MKIHALTVCGLLIIAAAANAAVYTVTPANEAALGWSHVTTYGADAGFSVAPDGASGAWFGNTGGHMLENGSQTGQVFIGTNNFSGVRIKDIRKLKYRCFTGDFTTFGPNHFPRTPFQLQLAVAKSSTGTYPTRYLMYRAWDWHYTDPSYPAQQQCFPYSGEGVPVPGGLFTSWYNEWQEYDCMSPDYGCWVDFLNLNLDAASRPFIGDWSHVVTKFGTGGKLQAPDGVGPDWAATWGDGSKHNPNGTCFNLVIGSPCSAETGSTISLSWIDNLNTRSFVDYVTIGYNTVPDDNTSYTEVTYYFRPNGTPRTIVTSNKGASEMGVMDKAKKQNFFVLYGWVLDSPGPTNSEFTISDGSGMMVKVKCKNHWMRVGDFVRVKGVVDRSGADHTMPSIFATQVNGNPMFY